MNSHPSFWRFLYGMLLLSGLAATAQPVVTNADQVLGPVPAQELPASGTFWFVQQHQPPLPWNPFPDLPVYLFGTNGGHFLVDDSQVDYVALREAQAVDRALLQAEMQLGIVQMSSLPELPGGGGGGGGYDPGVTNLPVAYDYAAGSFYIELVGVTNGTAFVALHGTVADELYQVFSKETLTDAVWLAEGEPFLGQDGLTFTSIPIFDRTNSLFLQARSWQDSEGSGMPDWWQLNNFGHLGVDPYADPDGDGWVNMQEYQNGTHPGVINIPPAPTGLQLQLNGTNCAVLLSWSPSPGLVDSYTVEKEGDAPQVFTVSTGVVLADTVARTEYPEFFGPEINTSYRVRGNYQNGAISYWSERKPVQREATSVLSAPAQIQAVSARNGQTAVLLKAVPLDTKWIRICRMDVEAHWLYGSSEGDVQWDVPIESFEGGKYVMPSQMREYPDGSSYRWHVQALGDGWEGKPLHLGYSVQWQDDFIFVTPPFVDGRRQMKDNLEFMLRVANRQSLLNLVIREPQGPAFTLSAPTNYVSSSFHEFAPYDLRTVRWAPEGLRPFRDNFALRNLVLNVAGLADDGSLLPEGLFYNDQLRPDWPLPYLFNQVVTNGASIGSLLPYNESKWTYMAPRRLDLGYVEAYGIYMDQLTGNYKMESSVRNLYGLPIVSQVAAWGDSAVERATVYPGGQLGGQAALAFIYPEAERPVLETEEYLFFTANEYDELPVPGHSEFDPHNAQRPFLVTGIGNDFYYVYSWAKQSLLNGYPDVYGFLGQYFERAVVVEPSGQITTNSAGLLTEYGHFFPTYPGQAALVTMPDLDTGARGTGIVHVIKLQLDVNHDGNMELDLTSPDNTSEAVPFRFWVNNDHDEPASGNQPDRDLNDWGNPPPVPLDYNYGQIRCQRNLEDFARLWVCGMPTLPTNQAYSVQLAWSQISSGAPRMRLYWAGETNGGIAYLTNTAIAAQQIAEHNTPIGEISPTSTLTLPANVFSNGLSKYFLYEAGGVGSGQLTLTISQGGTNTIAQTSAWFDFHDITDFYEMGVVTNVLQDWPDMVQTNLTSGFQVLSYAKSNSGDAKQLAVFIHGWRMGAWDWFSFSSTMFKRLWWQGYQGRFAALRWPTRDANTELFPQMGYITYNRSERIAFKSGTGAAAYLNDLRSRFPNYTISGSSHSMGGIVAMQTLKQLAAAGQQPVDNWVLMQAAVPAQCFDTNAPNFQMFLNGEAVAPTPNVYRNYAAGITNALRPGGKIANFFNPDDFALWNWQLNQAFYVASLLGNGGTTMKPNAFFGYSTDGANSLLSTNAWNQSFYSIIYGGYYGNGPTRAITDPLELMPFVARPRGLAVGASPNVHGQIQGQQLDLESQLGFGAESSDHSGQFNRNIQEAPIWPFYSQLKTNLFPQP